jgi:hypothetical protein
MTALGSGCAGNFLRSMSSAARWISQRANAPGEVHPRRETDGVKRPLVAVWSAPRRPTHWRTQDALAFAAPDGRRVEPETIRRYKLNLLGRRAIRLSGSEAEGPAKSG